MDEAFLREKYTGRRVRVAQHPSTTLEVWRAVLRRNSDPRLIEVISGFPEAVADSEIATLLAGR
jgi:hypothetical protein